MRGTPGPSPFGARGSTPPPLAPPGTCRGKGWWPGWWLMLLATVWGCGAAATLSAGDPTIAEVSIGLGGKFKVGYWTPVQITIQGGDADFTGQIELVLPDSDDVSARFVQASPETFQVPAGGQWVGWRYMKLGKIRGTMKVVLAGLTEFLSGIRPSMIFHPSPPRGNGSSRRDRTWESSRRPYSWPACVVRSS